MAIGHRNLSCCNFWCAGIIPVLDRKLVRYRKGTDLTCAHDLVADIDMVFKRWVRKRRKWGGSLISVFHYYFEGQTGKKKPFFSIFSIMVYVNSG